MMDLKFVKQFSFLVIIAITSSIAVSVAVQVDDAIKSNNPQYENFEFSILTDRINKLENQVVALQKENKQIYALLHELKTDSDDSELAARELTRTRRDAVVGGVAFSAYLNNTNSHMVPGQAIKFNQVLLNDGLAYNEYTGAFTAPVTGTYLFTFYFDTGKLTTFVRLVVNGVNEVDAVANPHTNAQSQQKQSMGGNAAIVHVLKGQAVLVETYEINDSEVASSDKFRLSSFSGVLLY